MPNQLIQSNKAQSMPPMERKSIAVIFGGNSPEYGVSLQSAHAVITHMDAEKYEPVLIGITKMGDWFRFHGDAEKIITDTWCNPKDCDPVAFSPNRSAPALLCQTSNGTEKIGIDAAFPVLHGRNGEDGTVQGMFELAGIPIIGCGVLSSALCMDKERAHKLVGAAGIAVPRSRVIERSTNIQEAITLAQEIGYPLFVKPVKAGSSFGITKVTGDYRLAAAIKLAFEYDDRVILEENIIGFEVGCAIMGNDALTVGEIDEIELAGGFFDFTEKYTLKTSAIHVPARIKKDTSDQIKRTAESIYKILDCRGFARVDMFLTPSGEIYFNEVNTIPGFTEHSRFPGMMKAAGVSFEASIAAVIEQAVGK